MENKNDVELKTQKDGKSPGVMKHGVMMMLCCLLPIVIIAGLPLFGIKLRSASLIFLLCPIMHIGMMFMMGKKGGSCHGDRKNSDK